jgi:hypothetical protein
VVGLDDEANARGVAVDEGSAADRADLAVAEEARHALGSERVCYRARIVIGLAE